MYILKMYHYFWSLSSRFFTHLLSSTSPTPPPLPPYPPLTLLDYNKLVKF